MNATQSIISEGKPKQFDGAPCFGSMVWDSLDSITLGATMIWGGLLWFASNSSIVSQAQSWPLFFLGAGLLVLLEVGIRLNVPAHRNDVTGDLIWTVFLFVFGGWHFIWPVLLIGIGVAKLRSAWSK